MLEFYDAVGVKRIGYLTDNGGQSYKMVRGFFLVLLVSGLERMKKVHQMGGPQFRQMSFIDCGRFANAVGAHCVSAMDATTGIVHMADILRFMEANI